MTAVMEDDGKANAARFAKAFLRGITRLKGAHVDREKFLRTQLVAHGQSREVIERALLDSPLRAGVGPDVVDAIAAQAISSETKRACAISFGTGIPGGLAILASVPADITQFYVHAYRVMQKVSYAYGWPALDSHDGDDDLHQIALFLGVMLDVKGAQDSLLAFSRALGIPAFDRRRSALNRLGQARAVREAYKKVVAQIARRNMARQATKWLPIVGGVVSGSLTFVTLNRQSTRLVGTLRSIPSPGMDEGDYAWLMNS
ncbi:hypothetical protein [Trueperella pecoris]|uniref:EcsC protein family protein n=1 Tax=Trueperella pecoris TaxID=2733571 RepID=A0A7M1QSG6_9ACTO|nr:hypothetical protein [Trueperella pecoris]QOQ38547.1 hypothetical protein HLG82_03165 [Trueperella pecoris]QOR44959.1 hypothetical protein INS88_06595 [Trueperella pecoris]